MRREDDYARFVDRQFRDMADREFADQRGDQERALLRRLHELGASDAVIEEARRAARAVAKSEGKTNTVVAIWADALLLEAARRGLLNARLEIVK